MGSDCPKAASAARTVLFQSTLPVWGATVNTVNGYNGDAISIHAPRVGSDRPGPKDFGNHCDFNPRSPCGERRGGHYIIMCTTLISIHAPRVGSDDMFVSRTPGISYFNPRSPCGERLFGVSNPDSRLKISIHAPRVGSDLTTSIETIIRIISIHAPRVGSDAIASR